MAFFGVFRCCVDDDTDNTKWGREMISDLRLQGMVDELEGWLERARSAIARWRFLYDDAATLELKADIQKFVELGALLEKTVNETIAVGELGFDSEEDLRFRIDFLRDGIRVLERAFEDD